MLIQAFQLMIWTIHLFISWIFMIFLVKITHLSHHLAWFHQRWRDRRHVDFAVYEMIFFIQTKRDIFAHGIWESRILGPHDAWKPNKVWLHSAFLSHPVCLAGISIVSSGICNCLQTEIWVWRLVPSPFHKPRCWGIRLALQAHGPMETLWQARGLVQPHGTPAKVPKLISCFVTQELQTTVVFRGLRVLIEDKVSKYHEVTRFQNRSGNFKEQHIAAWIEQIILWSVEENKHIYRKGVESSQQTNHKHSETNWILAG